MSKIAFQIIDNLKIRFGERIVSYHFSDIPFDGKHRYAIEGTGNERDKLGQHLFLYDFKEIHPSDLPNGISIFIQSPKSEFRQISFVQIQKANDRSELSIILSFDYSDWHLPVNLINFLENYRGTLIEELNGAIKCDIEPNEIGAHINCSI